MSNLKCCGCGVPVTTNYISHAMTDLPGTDGEEWGDTAIMLCDWCWTSTTGFKRVSDFRDYQRRNRPKELPATNAPTTPLPPVGRHPAPFTYSPAGDSDGETVGTDHFVLDGAGDELACPPSEDAARLFAASPDLLAACELWDRGFTEGEQFTTEQFRRWVNENRRAARAAIAKAKGEPT